MERALFLFFTFRSHQRCKMSIQKEKRDLKMEKIKSLNDAWKGYLKTRGLEPPTAAKGQQKCLDKAMLVCVFWGGRRMEWYWWGDFGLQTCYSAQIAETILDH